MRRMAWALGILVLGCGLAPAEPRVITGVREWHMADGKSKRLRIVDLSPDGKFVYFHDGKSKGRIPPVAVASLVAEEQAVLADLHAGKVVLCKVPSLSMAPEIPAGKAGAGFANLMMGDARAWQHANGKTIQARLVNLADDEVALLVGDSVTKVAPGNLSAADRSYLETLKGGAPLLAMKDGVEIFSRGWDGSPAYSASVPAARYAVLAGLGSGFQVALDAALTESAAKLPKGGWEFISLEEHRSHRRLDAAPEDKAPLHYTATFALEPDAYQVARTIWPLTVTPDQWKGPRELLLHLTADGEVLQTALHTP